jgi:hypothetical protein
MSTFSFSKVAIIESLPLDDFKSGTALCQYINGLKEDDPSSPPAELTEVNGSKGFLAKICELTLDAQHEGDFPILHIEMHGWNDKTGLAFPDNSSLSWHELADALALLNEATRFNLIVCVSTCFGGHFVGSVKPTAPGPCFALIGPTDTAKGDELLGGFRGFYRVLLAKLDAREALEALYAYRLEQGGFVTTTAEDWFFRLAKDYLERNCTPKRLKERADKIISQMSQEGKVVSSEQRRTIEEIGEVLAMAFLGRMFPRFFMIDIIPENTQRFANSLAMAQAHAESFFNANRSAATILPSEE